MSEKKGWFSRLKSGLSKTSSKLTGSISAVFTKRKLDAEMLEELEDALIMADLGPTLARELAGALKSERFGKDVDDDEVKRFLAARMAGLLAPVATPLVIVPARKPHVILMCGVNGTGKTTTLGKLATQWTAEGKSVMLAAADTFRAAATEQLQVWGQRSGVPVYAKEAGADPASLAYEALERAQAEGIDVLAIDTAGRLHNKAALMDELVKIVRVVRKLDADAPHDTLLTLDATTGQNAVNQVKLFNEAVTLTGLVVTKLDGSAKAGVVVALAREFGLPIHAVGVGEGADDLQPFNADRFGNDLLGL